MVVVSLATRGLLNIIREVRITAFQNVSYHWVKGTLVTLWKRYIFTKSAPSPVIMPHPTLFLLMVLLTLETPSCHQQVQPGVTIKFPFSENRKNHFDRQQKQVNKNLIPKLRAGPKYQLSFYLV